MSEEEKDKTKIDWINLISLIQANGIERIEKGGEEQTNLHLLYAILADIHARALLEFRKKL